jgi:hypothetical protein
MPTEFAQHLANIALKEFNDFGGIPETDARLRKRVNQTYLANLKQADPNDPLGWNMPEDISTWAWSAVFVSWCLLHAGAKNAEIDFSIRHAVFIKQTIGNALAGSGVFRGRKITEYKPKIGDIICANADGGTKTYSQASTQNNYRSHTAIVVGIQPGAAITIGGNEGNTIDRRQHALSPAGFVVQRSPDPYICVIEDRKRTVSRQARER